MQPPAVSAPADVVASGPFSTLAFPNPKLVNIVLLFSYLYLYRPNKHRCLWVSWPQGRRCSLYRAHRLFDSPSQSLSKVLQERCV